MCTDQVRRIRKNSAGFSTESTSIRGYFHFCSESKGNFLQNRGNSSEFVEFSLYSIEFSPHSIEFSPHSIEFSLYCLFQFPRGGSSFSVSLIPRCWSVSCSTRRSFLGTIRFSISTENAANSVKITPFPPLTKTPANFSRSSGRFRPSSHSPHRIPHRISITRIFLSGSNAFKAFPRFHVST